MIYDVVKSITDEARRASNRYGPFTSTHEGFGVLAEEVSELLDAIRSNDLRQIMNESIQVSAVAMRIADQCKSHGIEFKERSTK